MLRVVGWVIVSMFFGFVMTAFFALGMSFVFGILSKFPIVAQVLAAIALWLVPFVGLIFHGRSSLDRRAIAIGCAMSYIMWTALLVSGLFLPVFRFRSGSH